MTQKKENYLNISGLSLFFEKLKTLFATKDEIKGLKGDKGDPGIQGTSISKVEQTTTSTDDAGENVVTVTLSDGTTSTFKVKNGSKGSTGATGTNATTTAVATTSANGLMSKEMVQKLGAIDGITSDINSESDTIAASSKMVHDLNRSLSVIASTCDAKVRLRYGNIKSNADGTFTFTHNLNFNGGYVCIAGFGSTTTDYVTINKSDANIVYGTIRHTNGAGYATTTALVFVFIGN